MTQTQTLAHVGEKRLNGQTIIAELLRNLEAGQFEMSYSILLPCIFSVYLNPEDHARLAGVFDFIAEDAKRALCAQVARLNSAPKRFGLKRSRPVAKEYKIACKDWAIEFLADTENVVPTGNVEIHSELSEAAKPGFQGAKTTLLNREPTVTSQRPTGARAEAQRAADRVFAEIRYEDDSGPQLYLMTQNLVRVGRGGDQEPMDLALYTNDEVSREHMVVRRDAATGQFYIIDKSSNGTWLNGKRMKRDIEQALPDRADISAGEVITLLFQVRK